MKIAVIDYDAGNLRNVQKAFEHCGYPTFTTNRVGDIEDANVLILPGVGSFSDGMSALERLKLDGVIANEVREKGKPILGICLGMELLALDGNEGGKRLGLGLLPMSIQRLSSDVHGLRVPHMGWDNVDVVASSIMFSGIPNDPDFFFAHSYHAVSEDNSIVVATCKYGHHFVAAVERDNIFATQFHPEKSQSIGLAILKNFNKL